MPQIAGPTRPNRAARARILRPPPRRFYAFMCGMAVALGLIVFGPNLLSFWLDERVRTWPTTSGRLLSVEIGQDTVGVWYAGRTSAPRPVRERRFHVRYSYMVAGISYVGSQIGAHTARARVGGRSDRYVVGETVTAHYNPVDPREAVIETPFPFVAAMGIVVGVILLGIGWHIYVSQLRMPRGGVVAQQA